jgi:hypothetical protein
LHQECLNKLQHVLDLAMQTAETASAQGNHKLVLQAAREVTRIITLMTKLAGAPEKAASPVRAAHKTPARETANSEIDSLADGLLRDLFQAVPGLVNGAEPVPPDPMPMSGLFWKKKKGGKLPGKTSR